METNEALGSFATYGGSLTACATAPAAFVSESNMLLVFSALGAITAVAGLCFTVWNGNRNYKLAQRELELKLKENADGA